MNFSNKDGGKIIFELIKTIQDKKDFLSEVDGKIGDGDHGINMNKGFTMTYCKVNGKDYLAVTDNYDNVNTQPKDDTLLEDIGGSMGPLYGAFFDGLSEASEDHDVIDKKTFQKMIHTALEAIQDIGNAKRGDKTLLDTLIPAVEAYDAALEAGKDFKEALSELKSAAEAGWKSTEDMVAKIGRASRLGERSRGVLDAGATSCYLILESLATSIQSIL